MQKKKILIYHNVLSFGGISTVSIILANELARYKLDVYLLTISEKNNADLIKSIDPKVHLKSMVGIHKNSVLLSLWGLASFVKKQDIEIIVATGFFRNIQAILLKAVLRSKKVIVVEHVDVHSNFFSQRTTFVAFLLKRFLQLGYIVTYRFANHIIAVSQGAAKSLEKFAFLKTGKASFIYNPIITADLYKNASRHVSHRWFKAKHPPVIIAVGRFHPQKNFPLLLEAFAEVRLRYSKARLLILGDGAERPKLEALVKKLGLSGSVEMPGFVANPYAYMRRAKLFVLSSDYEGLPTVLVEALACGCPVVATNCPSGPDEILQGGKYGQLVTPGNKEELCAAICYVLENYAKEKKKVQQFHSHRIKDFTQEIAIKKYMELIDAP